MIKTYFDAEVKPEASREKTSLINLATFVVIGGVVFMIAIIEALAGNPIFQVLVLAILAVFLVTNVINLANAYMDFKDRLSKRKNRKNK